MSYIRQLSIIICIAIHATSLSAGIIVFEVDCLTQMQINFPLPPSNSDNQLTILATPGEFEPAAFAVQPDENGTMTVELTQGDYSNPLPLEWLELNQIKRLDSSSKLNRIYEIPSALSPAKGMNKYFWITARPPAGTPAGTYSAQVQIIHSSGSHTLRINLDVLPFSLQESPITSGVFMAETNLAPGWYQDMKDHGLDAIQYFSFYEEIPVEVENGRMQLRFEQMDSMMTDLNESGMKGPVVISLGNDYHLHMERRIAEAFGWPIVRGEEIGGKAQLGPEITPEIDSLFVEAMLQLKNHWQEKGYPQEMVILIYDEPTERLLDLHKDRFELLKSVLPDTRVYGVAMNRRAWAADIADQCDIIVANGDFDGCRQVAENNGLDYWVYSGPLGSVVQSRYKMGLMSWKAGASAVWFWMYNYWTYNPDGCAVYKHPDNPEMLVRTTNWEVIREGHDDLRYLATAEKLVALSGYGADEIERIKSSLSYNNMSAEDVHAARDALIDLIGQLTGSSNERSCDINGDSRVNISDVIALMLIGRAESAGSEADWNGDGSYSVADAISLLLSMNSGKCE